MIFLSFLSNHKNVMGFIAAFLAGVGVTFYYTNKPELPAQVITETKVVEKIVEKVVEVEKKTINTKIDRVTTIKKEKDGTETTVITDKSTSISNEEKQKTDNKTIENESEVKNIITNQKNWRLGVMSDIDIKSFEVHGGYRVFRSVWFETNFDTKAKQPKFGISVEF